MDQDKVQDSTKTSAAADSNLSLTSLSLREETEMNSSEIADILQATASHFARTAQSSNSSLVEKANDAEILGKMEEIVRTHFRPLKLTSLPSIIVFLLLNYFLLRREKKEAVAAKKLYEEHIALLKEKSSELEDRLREGSRHLRDSSPPSTQSSTASSDLCQSCEEYRQECDSLSRQYAKLKQSYDELCHINQQWAMDYESLTKQISNATGFHSVANSSSAKSTPNSTSTQYTNPNLNHTSSVAEPSCQRCVIYESQLEDKRNEIEDLGAMIVGLREDVKDCKEKLGQKQRELSSLENEYQILRLQMQEIGDLQQTLNLKQDYRKLQYSLQHKNKLYQDAMCEKLELQKQVEKLRQTFLKFFPGAMPSSSSHPASSSAPHTRTPQCYSFPMHSCRHNVQSHVVDPNPPTPPGLLARGDLRGGLVEKDEHPLPAIRLDEHPTASHFTGNQKQHPTSYHHAPNGGHMMNGSDHMTHYHIGPGAGSPTKDGNPRPISELVVTNQNASVPPRINRVTGMPQQRVSYSHSNDYVSHSQTTNKVSSLSPNMTSHTNTSSNSHQSCSLSSLGYVSDERNSMDPPSIARSTPNLVYHYPSRSKGSLGSFNSNSSTSGDLEFPSSQRLRGQMQKSLSEDADDDQSSQLFPRPTSLGLISRGGGAGTSAGGVAVGGVPGRAHGQQQLFVCPNCSRTLPANSQDGFESWFQHIKFCGA